MIRNRGHYWQVKVYAGRDPLTGQERREYGRASTKREAERLEAQLKAKVAEGRHRATAARTVADLLERWLEWRQGVKEISPTTLEDYRLQINRRIVPALGNLPVRRLDAETLDRFYAELRKRGRGDGKPLSASQVRSVHTVLSGALKQAVAWGWISHNPARLATPPALPSGEVTPPPVAQVSRLLALALERELRFGLFLRLAVVLGARRGELCGLRWRAIDLERGEVLLERGVVYVPGEPLIEKATKTRSKRRLALDARTVELLRAYLAQMQRTADELRSTLRADAFVFSREPDGSRPMHPSSMSHRFQEMARPLGLRCRLHDLRHLMVTHLISQGVDWRTAAGRAGHAGPHMTLGTYAHFQPAQDRHAADLLAELCDGDGRSIGAGTKDGVVLAERQDPAGGK
jgi:integrase